MGLSGTKYYNNKTTHIGSGFLDFYSGSIRSISNLHSHIHEAEAFSFNQTINSLANDGYMYFEIKTPVNNDIHLKDLYIAISEGPILIDILERPTLTTGTISLTPINLNRTRINGVVLQSGVVMKSNPTTISGGTSIVGQPISFGTAGVGVSTNPGYLSSQIERVLEKGENVYLVRIQNKNGSNISISVNLTWYE